MNDLTPEQVKIKLNLDYEKLLKKLKKYLKNNVGLREYDIKRFVSEYLYESEDFSNLSSNHDLLISEIVNTLYNLSSRVKRIIDEEGNNSNKGITIKFYDIVKFNNQLYKFNPQDF